MGTSELGNEQDELWDEEFQVLIYHIGMLITMHKFIYKWYCSTMDIASFLFLFEMGRSNISIFCTEIGSNNKVFIMFLYYMYCTISDMLKQPCCT